MIYFKKYIDSIYSGLNHSVYYQNNIIVSPEVFFKNISEILKRVKKNKNKLYFFGNGASAAFANHMALDFSKNGKILSRSLSDSALLTALSNDFTYEEAFVEFLKLEGVNKNDLIITISSSGNSPNIVNVLKYCNLNQIETLSFCGLKSDNKSISLSNHSLYVPMKTYGMVECIHQVFLHLILDELMNISEWDKSDFQNMNAANFKL